MTRRCGSGFLRLFFLVEGVVFSVPVRSNGEARTAGSATRGEYAMGAIRVHEFMSADGVIDAPTWTFEYGFDPKMGEAIAAVTRRSEGILLGRTTFEMFEPAWS